LFPETISIGHEFLRSATYTITLVRQTFTAYLKEEGGLRIGIDGDAANAAISGWANINGTYSVHVPYNAKKITVQAAVMEELAEDADAEIAWDLDGEPGSGDIRTGTDFDIAAKELTGQAGKGVLSVTVGRKFLSPMPSKVLIIRDTPTAYLGSLGVKGDKGDENLLKDFYKAGGSYGVEAPYNTASLRVTLSPDDGNPDAEVHYSLGGGTGTKVGPGGVFILDISGIDTTTAPEDRTLAVTVSHPHLTSMTYTVTISREPKTARLLTLDYRAYTGSGGSGQELEKIGAWTFNGRIPRYGATLPYRTGGLVFTAGAEPGEAGVSWTLKDGTPISGAGNTGAAPDLTGKTSEEIHIRVSGPYLESTEYIISLTRQEGSACLGGIAIEEYSGGWHSLDPPFSPGLTEYPLTIPYPAEYLRVKAQADADNPDAAVKVTLERSGGAPADTGTEEAGGWRKFTLDGTETALKVLVERDYLEATTYTFSLSRDRPPAYLESLKIKSRRGGGAEDGGAYTELSGVPNFAYNREDYRIAVPWDANEVTLEADGRYSGTGLIAAAGTGSPMG
jgi:hypothetical protein